MIKSDKYLKILYVKLFYLKKNKRVVKQKKILHKKNIYPLQIEIKYL